MGGAWLLGRGDTQAHPQNGRQPSALPNEPCESIALSLLPLVPRVPAANILVYAGGTQAGQALLLSAFVPYYNVGCVTRGHARDLQPETLAQSFRIERPHDASTASLTGSVEINSTPLLPTRAQTAPCARRRNRHLLKRSRNASHGFGTKARDRAPVPLVYPRLTESLPPEGTEPGVPFPLSRA